MKRALLLGAGFSYDLGMPTAYELTETFLGLFNQENSARLVGLLQKQKPFSDDRPIDKQEIREIFDLLLQYKEEKGSNYEYLLANIQNRAGQPSKSQAERDSCHFIFGLFYEIIHKILCLYQFSSYVTLYQKNKEWFSKLSNLLTDKETWVFSLNHDLFFECLSIDLEIPVTYGDTDAISFPVSNMEMNNIISLSCAQRIDLVATGKGFFADRYGVNLVKLHGSLSELGYKDDSIICNPLLTANSSLELMGDFSRIEKMAYYVNGVKIPPSKDRSVTNSSGEMDIVTKSMLTGGRKYSTTAKEKIGEEKLKIFDDILSKTHHLTVIGYGFGDNHINFRLSNAMARYDSLNIQIVDPARNAVPDFLQPFDYDGRIRMARCGAAHWMDYCKSNSWDTVQIAALKENSVVRDEIKEAVKKSLQAYYVF